MDLARLAVSLPGNLQGQDDLLLDWRVLGANFVKTSTGNALPGATVEDIRLMRATVGSSIGVKASGGINTLQDTLAFIEAGATRVASRSAVAIVESLKE